MLLIALTQRFGETFPQPKWLDNRTRKPYNETKKNTIAKNHENISSQTNTFVKTIEDHN